MNLKAISRKYEDDWLLLLYTPHAHCSIRNEPITTFRCVDQSTAVLLSRECNYKSAIQLTC